MAAEDFHSVAAVNRDTADNRAEDWVNCWADREEDWATYWEDNRAAAKARDSKDWDSGTRAEVDWATSAAAAEDNKASGTKDSED